MSAIVFDKVWKEYGDQSCSSRSISRSRRAPSWPWSGPSGCGKTTFLRMLLGEEHADARRTSCSTASR